MNTIKAILLDLGNVLVKFDAAILDKGYKPYIKLKDKKFSDYIIDSDNVNRYMEGKLTSSQFYTKTCRFFKMDIDFKEFYHIWNSMFFPYPEMESLVKSLKKKYPHIKLVLISNTNEEHYEFLKKDYDVLDVFDFRIVSHEVGALKPHPDIFSIALRAGGAKPKEAFYTDDREDLIQAARTMGIRAFQFTGHENLQKQLAKYEIHI